MTDIVFFTNPSAIIHQRESVPTRQYWELQHFSSGRLHAVFGKVGTKRKLSLPNHWQIA